MPSIKEKYNQHKRNATRRGIEFLLTFEEWLNIWTQSGKLDQRGLKRGQYVMCRNGDQGPYAVGNVYIDLNEINAAVPHKGIKKTNTHSQRIAQALKGKVHSINHVANNSLAQLNRPKQNCPHCFKIISGTGNMNKHVAYKHGILINA